MDAMSTFMFACCVIVRPARDPLGPAMELVLCLPRSHTERRDGSKSCSGCVLIG